MVSGGSQHTRPTDTLPAATLTLAQYPTLSQPAALSTRITHDTLTLARRNVDWEEIAGVSSLFSHDFITYVSWRRHVPNGFHVMETIRTSSLVRTASEDRVAPGMASGWGRGAGQSAGREPRAEGRAREEITEIRVKVRLD